jgi:pimeloyl-ACP methyl ester carboxylesterase
MRPFRSVRLGAGIAALCAATAALPAAAELSLSLLDREGRAIAALTDGDAVQLRASLPAGARRAVTVDFHLDAADARLASCVIRAGERGCDTDSLRALGWYWTGGRAAPERRLAAGAQPGGQQASMPIRIRPRPVVLVHGFLSSARTWQAYTGSGGFLAAAGLTGYAVGDGQAEGTMNTGDAARPRSPTATLPENAAALGRYIAGVKSATGAQMVDVVAHSMGGLIARYYIARLMKERDIAQLLMLGSPHGGSDCSGLPSALGFFAPAALELRPAYLQRIFNPAVARRRGVEFHTLAGDAIVDGFRAPCTGVPSDLVVGVDSAAAIAGELERLPVLHTAMTASAEAFRDFVLPRLRRPAGDFAAAPDPPLPAAADPQGQFTRIFAGRVEAGGTTEIRIDIDRVAVAGFALFDPSRALSLTVFGASGNAIALTPDRHGLIRVDDPASLVHLGYGIDRPQPGPWRVALQAPPEAGSDFALSVRVSGGPRLIAAASTLTPRRREVVRLAARLEAEGAATPLIVEAVIQRPDGVTERLPLRVEGNEASVDWRPAQAGLHSVDIVARSRVDGLPLERTALLVVEVRR